MSTSPSLPNQVNATTVAATETKENLEMKMMREEIKQIRTDVDKQIKEKLVKDEGERRKAALLEGVLLDKISYWISVFVFTVIAGYWVIKTVMTYSEGSIYISKDMTSSKTVPWPSVIIEPHRECYKKSAMAELERIHDVRRHRMITIAQILPFHMNKNFNWSAANVSDMVLQLQHSPPHVNFTTKCTYISAATNETDCYSKKMGTWENYQSPYNMRQVFTPAPASSNKDHISITLNSSLCDRFVLSMVPFIDRMYTPETQNYIAEGVHLGMAKVQVQEFHSINRESAPCMDDVKYSKAGCVEVKVREYAIQRAGCHFPAVTGYQQMRNYPECNTSSSLNKFRQWHKELASPYRRGNVDDLQDMLSQCEKSCHTVSYCAESCRFFRKSRQSDSRFIMRMARNAMSIEHTKDKWEMTLENLVANVGGIIGSFLVLVIFIISPKML